MGQNLVDPNLLTSQAWEFVHPAKQALVGWVDSVLEKPVAITSVRERPWSVSFKVSTREGVWWAKAVTPGFVPDYHALTPALVDRFSCLPEMSIVDRGQQFMLIPYYGSTLKFMPTKLPWLEMLASYGMVQPELPTSHLSTLSHFDALTMVDRDLVSLNLVSPEQRNVLVSWVDRSYELCDNIPWLSVHNDIHANNVTVSGVVLDWSDSSILPATCALLSPVRYVSYMYGRLVSDIVVNRYLQSLSVATGFPISPFYKSLPGAFTISALAKIRLFVDIAAKLPEYMGPCRAAITVWLAEVENVRKCIEER